MVCILNINIAFPSNDVRRRRTGQPSQYGDSLDLDRIPVGARIFASFQAGSRTQAASCTMGNGYFLPDVEGPGRSLTTHHYLAPRLKEDYSYTSTDVLGLNGLL
jgi:hypothetical protein